MADVNKSLQDKLEKLKKKYDNSTLMDTSFISTGSIIADTVLVDSKLTKERGIEGGLPTSKYMVSQEQVNLHLYYMHVKLHVEKVIK